MYKKGDFLVTEGEIFITTNDGRLILLREHPIANPNFSIKCSEYFGTNYINIKTTVQHKQLSLTNGTVIDKENHAVTDFISVDELKEYAFTSASSFFRISFYDASKNFISSDSTEVVFNQRWIENLPTGTKFIRISAEYFTIQTWGLYELTNERAFAITYFDKKVEVHLPDFYGVTRALVGTPDLFSLSYISDTKDKGQVIMSTEADINIHQDDYFNIDNLATSGETDIKVKYYEGDALMWTGFVLPDFFQVDISNNPIITMVATDRLGVLKEIDFNGVRDTPRFIIEDCLAQTGLSLSTGIIYPTPLYLNVTPINLERYDGMTCHEVLVSVLTAFNMKIVQYGNKWNAVNKRMLETRATNNFVRICLVDTKGMREIKPVASEVSMKMEFGGSQHYPKNWNFRKTDLATIFESWNIWPTNLVNKRQVIGYDVSGSVQTAILGSNTNVNSLQFKSGRLPELGNVNPLIFAINKSSWAIFKLLADIDYTLDFKINFTSASNIEILSYVLARKDNEYFAYYKNASGDVVVGTAGTGAPTTEAKNPIVIKSADRETFGVVQTQWSQELKIDKDLFGVSKTENDTIEFQIVIMQERSYTSPISETDIFINSAELVLNDNETTGKGLIFKIKQGGTRFSKSKKEQTIHFSDKINQGVNGYFYNYKDDDTSIANLPNEFILQNTLREQAQMFSKARDFLSLSGNIKVNPLARYICGEKQYVLVGGTSGRKNASVQLEEIVDENLTKIDYIYTYFD